MAVINQAIANRPFELIRDRIAEILAEELFNQSAINYDESLDATVYTERFVPFDRSDMPCVNVMLTRGTFDNYKAIDKDGTFMYFIDVYHRASSNDLVNADELAHRNLQRLIGVIDAILSDTRYVTLGYERPFISRVEVTEIKIAEPKDDHDAQAVAMGRVFFSVRVPQRVASIQPRLMAGYDTQVKIGTTDKGYIYSGDDIPVPEPTCEPVLIYLANGSVLATVNSGGEYTLPDTAVTVVDTDGNQLSTQDLPSVTGGNVTAPDATYLVEYENGTPIQSGSILSGGNEVVQVPNPIVCADGIVNINGTLFDTVASGDTLNIQVRKSTGNDQIGSKQGQYWRIPDSTAVLKDSSGNTLSTTAIKATETEDIPAPDVDLEINSVAVDSFPSGSTIDVQLTDGVNPVTPTSVTVVGNVVTAQVAAGGVIQRSTAKNMQTGQVTSYGANDDADSRLTVGRLDDFMTLDAAPVHNDGSATINTTTNRFTDILGGQTYTDNIVLDWSTWNGSTLLGYYRLPNATNVDWDAARVAANGYSIGSFSSGWGVPNRGEYFSICKHEGTTLNYPLNYAPFNISLATVFLTSTTPAGSSNCFTLTNNASANFGNQPKTSLGRFIARRQFSLSTSNILS